MKKKLRTFKFLNQQLGAYSKSFYFWYSLDIVLQAVTPLLTLVVTGVVIELLSMPGTDVQTFIQQITLWMGVVLIAKALNAVSVQKLRQHGEMFRNFVIMQVWDQQFSMDYPLVIGAQAQERYNRVMMALDHSEMALNETVNKLRDLIGALIATILYINILSQLDLLFLGIILLLLVLLIGLKRKQQRVTEEIQPERANNQVKNRYIEKIMGDQRVAKDIRLYSMKGWLQDVQADLWQAYEQIIRPETYWARVEGIVILVLLTGMYALAYHQSIQQIIGGEIQVANFVVYVGLISMITSTLTTLVTSVADFNRNLTELQQLRDYAHQEPVFNHGQGPSPASQDHTIEIRNLSYTYPNADPPTFHNLNLTIHPREKLAIVGENGAGKTTLTKLILGLLLPDSGEILLDGVNIRDYNIDDYYDLFAPVFQDTYLMTFTIRDTILQGSAMDQERYERVLRQSGMDEVVAGLEHGDETHIVRQVHSDGVHLSGGQMQKLQLAKALYKDAPMLILDEPTAALDPISESEVYQSYLQFAQGKMALFISHRLASTQFCDRIIYLSQGEIIEMGSHDELMTAGGAYHRLFETQAYYYHEDLEAESQEEIVQGGVI